MKTPLIAVIPVILCGGSGSRLWPVSRRLYPKPFMRLDDGESLLEKTARRAHAACAGAPMLLAVSAAEHRFLVEEELAKILPTGPGLKILLEPSARNTAPAVLLAALAVRDACGADAQLLVLPADHVIDDQAAFNAAVTSASALAARGQLVTFGVVPTRAETGYGYIERGDPLDCGFSVRRFVEKPDLATAQAYLASGSFLWNAGMFCFSAASVLKAAATHCGEVLAACERVWQARDDGGKTVEFSADLFATIPEISIDYALMERASERAVVPATFDWNDIGSWQQVAEQTAPDAAGNRLRGDALAVDSSDSFVHAQSRTVALVGVSGLSVIETADAVLVVHRDRAQQVKQVVERLRAAGNPKVDVHQTVRRPWGSYTVLEDAADCKVKRLTVKPGGVLSLQYHHRRSEHWTVVSGTAKVRIGDDERLITAGESVYIPQGSLHRLENPGERDIHLIEVQCGEYFGEDDIVRLEDRYGRAGSNS